MEKYDNNDGISPWNPVNPSHGWWAIAVCFSTATALLGFSTYTFSLFGNELAEQFHWSRTQINASLSFSAIGTLFGPFLGGLIDRRGPRIVVGICVSLTALSFLLRPMMSELWHWYALSFLQYAGFSATMAPVGRIVGLWFPRRRGTVMGIAMTGNNFGGVVMPGIVGGLIANSGWQAGYYLQGTLTAFVAIGALIALREPNPVGLVTSDNAGGVASKQLTGISMKQAVRSPQLYMLFYIFLVGATPFAALLPQLISHFINEGIESSTAATALSLVALGGMGGKLIFGIVAEKITPRYTMMISFAGLSVSLLLSVNLNISGIIWICSPMWGLCMGAFGTLINLIVQDYFGLKNFAKIMGIAGYGTAISFAIGPILAGISFDEFGNYHPIFYGTMVLLLAGILVLIGMGNPNVRQQE